MNTSPESQTPATPEVTSPPIDEKRPTEVKAVIITSLINYALILVFIAMFVIFYIIISRQLEYIMVRAYWIAAMLVLPVTMAGLILSITVLIRHRRWKKIGVFGLIANVFPVPIMILIFFFLSYLP